MFPILSIRFVLAEDFVRKSHTRTYTWFPHRLENWESIFQSGKSRGILNTLEMSENFTQNTGKVMEFQTI